MECARHRVSFATWRVCIFRQLLLTSHPSRISRRSTASSAELHEQLSPETETRVNEDTKRIPPSQRLPQSPVITHPRNEPKKNRKSQPTREDLDPLANNPWAVALASPVRMCAVTGARLPRALLGEWGFVQGSGPNADRTYMMPVGLLKDTLAGRGPPEQTSTEEDKSPDTETSTPTEKQAESEASAKPTRDEQPGRQLYLRMVERLSHLRKITPPLTRSSPRRSPVARIIPFRWKHPQGPITSRQEKAMVWREDMPEFVLRHMQMDVVRKLERTCQRYKRLGAANGVWNVVEMQGHSDAALVDALGRLQAVDRAECGAVLLLGPFSEGIPSAEAATLPQTQSKVPCFDMSVLLSESDMQTLRETAAPHFQNTALFFRPNSQLSVDVMLSLWKLKCFLAEDPRLSD